MRRFEANRSKLEIRLVDRLRSAGGELLRNELREAVCIMLTARQFDALVNPLLKRGEVICEQVWRQSAYYAGRRLLNRRCTIYRLANNQPKRS